MTIIAAFCNLNQRPLIISIRVIHIPKAVNDEMVKKHKKYVPNLLDALMKPFVDQLTSKYF